MAPVLTPRYCVCPGENFTCVVNSGIGLAWRTYTTDRDVLEHSLTDEADEVYVEEGGFQVTFRRAPGGKFTSSLHVGDLGLNGTNITCEGVYLTVLIEPPTTTICVVGNLLSLFFKLVGHRHF